MVLVVFYLSKVQIYLCNSHDLFKSQVVNITLQSHSVNVVKITSDFNFFGGDIIELFISKSDSYCVVDIEPAIALILNEKYH